MFTFHGDALLWDGEPVAQLLPGLRATLREELVCELDGVTPSELYDSGHDAGFRDGYQKGEADFATADEGQDDAAVPIVPHP